MILRLIFSMLLLFVSGCAELAEESIQEPLCPPEVMSTDMCINNPQSPCCDAGND